MTYATFHFLRFIIFSVIIFVSFIAFNTPKAEAYFTTAQAAVPLDNHYALFEVDYKFGHSKFELHMPVLANNSADKSNGAVSYMILDEEGNEVQGKISGIVFSSAKLSPEGMYVIPKGTSENFRLAVVFTPDTYVQGEKYRLQVTHLPFAFVGAQQLKLNPSELTYYTTKYTTLD